MGLSLVSPKQQFFDNNGNPLSGGKLYTKVVGGGADKTTYSDALLTSANANPVILNARGEASVFAASGEVFWLSLTDASDVTIWTQDNITIPAAMADFTREYVGGVLYPQTANESSAGVTPVSYSYPPGDVRRYGAISGTAVNTTAIQAAINANKEIRVPDGEFLSRQLNVPSDRVIYGEGTIKRDPSWTGSSNVIFVVGSNSADVSNVTIRGITLDMNGADSFGRLIQLGQPDVSGTLYTSSNIRIEDVRFKDSNPYASGGDKWAILWRSKLENVWVERCHSSDDMQLTAGGTDTYKNINVLNNRVVDGRGNGIAFSAGDDNHVVDGIKVVGNYIECEALCILLGPDAIYAPNTGGTWNDVLIAHNTCHTNPDGSSQTTWFGIYCNATQVSYQDVRIQGNSIDNRDTLDSQRGIRFVDENAYGTTVSEAIVSGNNIRNCRVGVDIAAGGCVNVNGNIIDDCTDGVYFDEVGQPSVASSNAIRGGSRAFLVNNANVTLIGNVCPGGTTQTGSNTGRLTLAPAAAKTATVLAIGNKFTDGSSGTNIYGVRGDVTGTAVLRLIDNDLSGNDAAVDNITPTSARGNIGYVTSNGGVTSAIASGATVNHGLSVTPEIVLVTALDSGPADIYVTAIGASTFVINYGGGGTHTFAWEARDSTHHG